MTKISLADINSLLSNHCKGLKKKIKSKFPSGSKYTAEEILVASPKTIKEIVRWYDSLTKVEQDKFVYIKNAYANFIGKKKEYNAYDLAKRLNVNVCPYCNRNYTYTVISDKELSRPEFDHFYSKDKYPILALSFFNLIPSCHLCNSTLKGTAEFSINTYVYPYEESLDKHAKFLLTLLTSDFYFKEDGFDIELKPNCSTDKKAQNTIDVFRLNEIYKHHKDIILELIQKAEMYNDSYIDELMKNYEGTLFKNREDLLRLIFGGYITDEEIGKRPLSKLTKDILEQLEII